MILRRSLILCLALVFLASLPLIRDEWRVHRASIRLATAQNREQGGSPAEPADSGPARASLLNGLTLVQLAARQTDPRERKALLNQADAAFARAETGRPHWGDVTIGRVYGAVVAGRAMNPATIQAFARSYAQAPYVRGSVLWRLRYGALTWSRLDPATRNHVLDEAIWLSMLGPANYMRAWSALHGTPALAAYLARRSGQS